MKVLKWIFIVVLTIVAIALLWAAFLPSERLMEQSITIKQSARLIFKQVNSLKNWDNWSPFLELDSGMHSTYSGPDYGVGASQRWSSKVNGSGSMTILRSDWNSQVVYALDFGMGSVDTTWFTITPQGDLFQVTWGTKLSHLGYPMGRIWGSLSDATMGKVFQKGLQNMKKYLEALQPDFVSGEIALATAPPHTLLASTRTIAPTEIASFLHEAYGTMVRLITNEKLRFAGVPMAIYSGDASASQWGVTAAIPIMRKPKLMPQGYYLLDRPEQRIVAATHWGAYDTVEETYARIMRFIADNNLTPSGDMWEEYISDPEVVTDPMKLETRVCFPIE